MDAGEVRARLILDMRNWDQSMSRAQTDLRRTGSLAQQTSKDLDKISKAAFGVGSAVALGIGASIKTAGDFEKKMSDIKSVSGATADQMAQLSNLAKEAGKTTAFSASEAAQGIEELIKAGLSVEQIMGGGLKGALDLAAAGELQLADAAEIASTALNAFRDDNLTVVQSANLLAGAANASATDVGELKFGLSAVSAVASGVGMSFKDTTTALALFAQNGLKGSDAGTSLKTMLMTLTPSTKEATELFKKLGIITKDGSNQFYDAQGNLKSLADVTDILRKSLEKLNPQQRGAALKEMFGSDAVRAGTILFKEGAAGVERMADAMSKITAAETAATKLDNLYGSVEALKGSAETFSISLGEDFLPLLTDLAKAATEVIGELDEMDMANIKGALSFAGVASAVALVGSGLGKLALSARALMTTMGPAGWLLIGVSALSGVIAGTVVKQNELNEVTLDHVLARKKEAEALDSSINQFDQLRSKSKLTTDEFARFVDINSELAKTADPDKIARLSEEQENLRKSSGLSNDELNKMVGLNDELVKKVPESTKQITAQGNAILESTSKLKQYSAAQLDRAYKDLELEKIKNETKYRDLLKEQTDLINKRHSGEEKLQSLVGERNAAQATANEEQRKLNVMLSESEKHSQAALDAQVQKNAVAQGELERLQKKLEKQATSNEQSQEDLEKTREKLKKLEEVRNQMAQIQLAQVGLNSKTGEELITINNAIGKLKEQKKTLEDTTPAAQKNTAEYRSAVSAINEQIGKLESAKDKVEEITGKAIAMNAELSKDIYKTIYQNLVSSNGYSNAKANALKYHGGGIVAPKLHDGGLASKFSTAPNHTEVDVRLLKDEMVLTQSQQSHLFKMLDTGMTNGNSQRVVAETDPSLIKAIEKVASRPTTVIMDDREVGRIVEPHVTELQTFKQDRKGRF